MEWLKKRIPNALTFSRIPCAIGFFGFHLYERPILALTCFVVGCITDYFDGHLARKWNATSDRGKKADPYCDKAICWAMTIAIVHIYGFNPVVAAVVGVQLAYDGGLSVLRYVLGQVNIPVNQYAKWKTTMLMIGFTMLYVAWMIASPMAAMAGYAVLVAAMMLALMSIATYLRGYKLGWLIPYPLRLIF